MHKSQQLKGLFFYSLYFITSFSLIGQTNTAPEIMALGRQVFCPGSPINIVTDFSITDPDDTTIPSFYIQISSGYQVNFDHLELTGNHSNILSSWNNLEGKLTLTSSNSSTEIVLTELEDAVKDIVFTTTTNFTSSEKTFSLTIDDANYLPSTDHFYEFVSESGITWSEAKVAAENRTYYGRQGYLTTLTNQEEADFAGKQATGTGWIGASDNDNEGVWKWVTGPESGTVFWNGDGSGSSPNGQFANWHLASNEPNNVGGNENYAHITHPNLNVPGKWNDLPDISTLEPGSNYYPQGYIVEYGNPGDPILNIVASTSIYIPNIAATANATICESGSTTISAIPSEGTILWFDSLTGGTQLATGNSYSTPVLNSTTTYYATISINGCNSLERTAVIATVNQRPTITSTNDDLICSGNANLSAFSSQGLVYWYDSPTSLTPIFIGNNFQTPFLDTSTSYYVEGNIQNCISSVRTEITANIDNTTPEFDVLNNNVILCSDIGSIDLEVVNAQGFYTYAWEKEGNSITGNSALITVSSPGTYSVKAFSEAGCESIEQTILVTESEKATITNNDVIIKDDSENNYIQITNPNLGNGNYQFTIDDEFGIYKDEAYFENLQTGIHTLFIKDTRGCGIEKYVFSILEYPKFFTPNQDGTNDLWKISGYDKTFYTTSDILIYNRFGNLIYQFNDNNEGWDGNYKGKKSPPNSYWFKVTLTDINGLSIEKIGNFSLIRK